MRKQVAADLKRLESLLPKPNASQLMLLIKGYKQSGASPEMVKAAEDRLLRQYPESPDACLILEQRWRNTHPEPKNQADAAAWALYDSSYKDALKGWMLNSPGNLRWGYEWFWVIFYAKDTTVSEAERVAALESYRQFYVEQLIVNDAAYYVFPPPLPWQELAIAEFMERLRWRPEQALALLRGANVPFEKDLERMQRDDDLPAKKLESQEGEDLEGLQQLASLTLDAAKLLDRPEEALGVKAIVEGPIPKPARLESDYWWNRAKLAALEGHKVDALAYYQIALRKRLQTPRAFHGKLTDDLTEQASALWKEVGGGETAWAVWTNPASGGIQELTDVSWRKPSKPLPPFDLADLSGKAWRLKDLAGKSVLIDLWATWCGSCVAELPYIQEMYEKSKGRIDIQLITFNLDDDLGRVAPFLKEKGYTFPVLSAYTFVHSLLGESGWSIPQDWIVDPKGKWRLVQWGFDTQDPKWMDKLIQQLEAVKTSD